MSGIKEARKDPDTVLESVPVVVTEIPTLPELAAQFPVPFRTELSTASNAVDSVFVPGVMPLRLEGIQFRVLTTTGLIVTMIGVAVAPPPVKLSVALIEPLAAAMKDAEQVVPVRAAVPKVPPVAVKPQVMVVFALATVAVTVCEEPAVMLLVALIIAVGFTGVLPLPLELAPPPQPANHSSEKANKTAIFLFNPHISVLLMPLRAANRLFYKM